MTNVWSFAASCVDPSYDDTTGVLQALCWGEDGHGYRRRYIDLKLCLWVNNKLEFGPLLDAPSRSFMPIAYHSNLSKAQYWMDGTKLMVRRESINPSTRE